MKRKSPWPVLAVAVLASLGALLFVHDAGSTPGTTERVSVDSAGNQGNSASYAGSISADGRYVAFVSESSGNPAGLTDLFLHDWCPDGSCGGPPPNNVVLFIQGAGSESHCDDGSDDNYNRISWLKDYLSEGWPQTLTGLLEEDFLYYDYTTHADSPTPCPDKPIPDYRSADACWSLDDKYKLVVEHEVERGGEARRLAAYLHDYLNNNAGARISIIAHSQGGVIAAYAVTGDFSDVLTDDDRSRIQAIVTLDSPLGGVPAGGALLYELSPDPPSCFVGPEYDSASDMASTAYLIARLHNPPYPSASSRFVPLFTVDADPGNVDPYTIADDAHSRVTQWETAHLSVAAPGHGDVWTGQLDPLQGILLRRFVLCAVAGLSPPSQCSDFAWGVNVSVSPGQVVFRSRLVPASVAKLTTLTVWPGSTIGTTLVSPSGRRIDANTVADDVTHFSSDASEWFELTSPEAGDWTIEFSGINVPPEGETATFSMLAIPDAANDVDADQVSDDVDDCPGVFDPNQSDIDQDGLGDACDPDIDNDGVPNASDNCPLIVNPGQEDPDGNGLGDACDPSGVVDSDLDGLVDNSDNCPLQSNSDQVNTDGDYRGDACDWDDDNDGGADGADNCPLVPNADQQNTDAACISNGGDIPRDCRANPNKDVRGDACDLDDDNDGLTDAEEAAGCGSASTDPLKKDTDGDTAIDGYECKMGTDPNNPADRPHCTDPTDTDGDGFSDCVEELVYGTSAVSTDTDGDSSGNDGCQDDKQVVDVNGDGQANITDVFAVARIALVAGSYDPVSKAVADINKDGASNITDVCLAARNSTLVEPHDVCR